MNTLVTQTEHQHEHLVGIIQGRLKATTQGYSLVTILVNMRVTLQGYLRENTLEII